MSDEVYEKYENLFEKYNITFDYIFSIDDIKNHITETKEKSVIIIIENKMSQC